MIGDPTYVVMLYIYKGVHNLELPGLKTTRELALAVPVYVTQDRAVADMFAEEEKDPDYIYDVVRMPLGLDDIAKLISDFEKRREMTDAGAKA
jgi:hypothetical protein